MNDKKDDKNLNNKKKDDFFAPEINPLDEIKNYSPKKKLIEKVGEELLPEKAVYISMKNDKEKLRKNILKDEGNKVENIARNINAEARGNEDLNVVLDRDTYFKKTNYKKQKILVAVIFLMFMFLLISGISYYVLNNDRDLSDLPKIDLQQQIILSSMKTMKNVKTYSFAGNFEAKSNTKDPDGKIITKISTIDVSGKIDEADINYSEVSYNLKIRNDILSENKNEFTYFDLDMLVFGNNDNNQLYVKLNEYDLDSNEILMIIFEAIVEPYINNWYVVESEDLENITKADNTSTIYNINRINDFYNKYEFIKFKEDLGDSKLNNINVYHYGVLLNSDAVIDFYLDTLEETTELKIKIEEFRNNPEKYRELIDGSINSAEIEIWIGKTDNFVYRIKADLNLNKDFFSELSEAISDDKENYSDENNIDKTLNSDLQDAQEFEIYDNSNTDVSYDIGFDLAMFDFDEPVEIFKPEDTEDFSDVIREIFGVFDLTKGDSDLDGLTDDMEDHYGTDINNSDTDGDGYSDGDEINNGYDPLVPGDAKLDIK